MKYDQFRSIPVPDEDLTLSMVVKQHGLMVKYEDIEKKNGAIIPELPFTIDDRDTQQRLKDLFWRTTEELAEAYEKRLLIGSLHKWKVYWDSNQDIFLFLEELSDALHFLIEATLAAHENQIKGASSFIRTSGTFWKISSDEVNLGNETEPDLLKERMFNVIRGMGFAANQLKNRPWKETITPTDKYKFMDSLQFAWRDMGDLFRGLGCSLPDVYRLYVGKHKINEQRQESGY